MNQKMHYVYALHCPIDDVIRYIGYSAYPEQRYKSHLTKNKHTHKDKMDWVLKLRSLGLKPSLIILKKSPSKTNALMSEGFYIKEHIDTILNVKKPSRKNPKSFKRINEQMYLDFKNKCKDQNRPMHKVLQELITNYNKI